MNAPGTSSIATDLRVSDLASARRADRAANAARTAGSGNTDSAAEQLESLFATTLVSEMRKGLSDGFFGSGPGADVFEGWLDQHVGDALAKSGALDLAGIIKVNLGFKQSAAEEQEIR